ncbi:MAG: hypothetical protein OXF75_08115 [Acidimicrobiaceae bacterium]|nr:hypothetical protein [Acidimicrobiaceae bacterium]
MRSFVGCVLSAVLAAGLLAAAVSAQPGLVDVSAGAMNADVYETHEFWHQHSDGHTHHNNGAAVHGGGLHKHVYSTPKAEVMAPGRGDVGGDSYTITVPQRPAAGQTLSVFIEVDPRHIDGPAGSVSVSPKRIDVTADNYQRAHTVRVVASGDALAGDWFVVRHWFSGGFADPYVAMYERNGLLWASIPRFDVTGRVSDEPVVTSVPGDWDLIPSGLSAGDKFRLLFITSAKSTASSSDIEAYNGFVQARAAAGHAAIRAHSGGFRAVGSTATVDAIDNAMLHGDGAPIYWLNGLRSSDDYADFCDGSWASRAARDESGAAVVLLDEETFFGNGIWTGTDHDCTARAGHELGSARPQMASMEVVSGSAHGPLRIAHPNAVNQPNTNSRRLYALSGTFVVSLGAVLDDDHLSPTTPPAVSIAGATSGDEGTPAAFTLSAVPAPSTPLTVTVDVAQTGDYAAAGATGRRTVVIPTSGTATVSVNTVDDNADEPDGEITLTVQPANHYTLGNPATLAAPVLDNDPPQQQQQDEQEPEAETEVEEVETETEEPEAEAETEEAEPACTSGDQALIDRVASKIQRHRTTGRTDLAETFGRAHATMLGNDAYTVTDIKTRPDRQTPNWQGNGPNALWQAVYTELDKLQACRNNN